MYTLDLALRIAVLSQLVFVVVLLVRAGWPLSRARKLAVCLTICFAAYMYCSSGAHAITAFNLPIIALCILIPPLFWLFANAAFDDGFRFRMWHGAALAAVLAVGLIAVTRSSDRIALAMGMLSRVLSLIFILSALWIAYRDRSTDLVESRRQFRDWLTTVVGLYMVAILAAEIALLGKQPSTLVSTLNVAAILVLAHLAAHGLSRARVQALEAPPSTPKNATVAVATEAPLLTQLLHEMEEKCIYRENGLTISALAARLSTTEHVLRRLINQELGYRNFNEFLNRYRLRDACHRLRAPETRSLPVLTIALDVGYSSITPFNRAFKEMIGMTPTQYRERSTPPHL
ncbi:MAG TPA: helix-turn-helix domain-containing protein [Steroidobacteraceae bacterium]|nr:helix-turn-helix domain-containing protein [Steroidobacteraceae bacterium]